MDNNTLQTLLTDWQALQAGDNWTSETFDQKLEMVNEHSAFIQPIPEVHCVAELVQPGKRFLWFVNSWKTFA